MGLILVNYPLFGLAGAIVMCLCIVVSAAVYTGKRGERYSPWNHFISELGEQGVSKAAAVFNIGLILGGMLFVPFVIGLACTINNTWAFMAGLMGAWAGVSVLLVGVFPMNNLTPHIRAAMSYFRSGLLAVLLFSLAIFLQPADARPVPLAANLFGLLAVITYSLFLIYPRLHPRQEGAPNILDPESMPQRPAFWLLAALEWAVFLSTILWFMGISLAVL